jgi:hypothetical protein
LGAPLWPSTATLCFCTFCVGTHALLHPHTPCIPVLLPSAPPPGPRRLFFDKQQRLHARTVSKATELGFQLTWPGPTACCSCCSLGFFVTGSGFRCYCIQSCLSSLSPGGPVTLISVHPYFCPPLFEPQQRLHARTVSKATELGDSAYLARSKGLLQLLLAATVAAESFLAPGMSNIAAASKVNTVFRNAWAKTPQVRGQGGGEGVKMWRYPVVAGRGDCRSQNVPEGLHELQPRRNWL